jgi:thiamine biosynthesis lipoprotein
VTDVQPVVSAPDLRVSFRSMASDIRFWVVAPGADAQDRADAARAVVERVAASCTRFDPSSALMRANAAGRRWAEVPRECYDAIAAAHQAHVSTGGLFDPRVLRVLSSYGYDVSLPFESRALTLPETSAAIPRRRGLRDRTWRPGLDAEKLSVRIGREPIDLGGIGKGLAVRWASAALRGAGSAALVEAGGDVMAIGAGPDGAGWSIAVENPRGGEEPTAVLKVRDRAVATSSTRVRSWTVGDRQVHHLIDPRTRRPAESDLVAVTVVDRDPALAEVWSKSMFVLGRKVIRTEADERGLAALWVDTDGRVGVSRAMRQYVAWQVSRVS